MIPSVFVTAKHYNPGLKRDAASVWIEDVTQSSCNVCLRELQNYAGSHQDVVVVSHARLISWNRTNSVFRLKLSALDWYLSPSLLFAFLRFQQLVQGCTIFCLKIYFLPFVSSSSGFVNPIMLLLSCNLRYRWLFYINLLDILPFYFRR